MLVCAFSQQQTAHHARGNQQQQRHQSDRSGQGRGGLPRGLQQRAIDALKSKKTDNASGGAAASESAPSNDEVKLEVPRSAGNQQRGGDASSPAVGAPSSSTDSADAIQKDADRTPGMPTDVPAPTAAPTNTSPATESKAEEMTNVDGQQAQSDVLPQSNASTVDSNPWAHMVSDYNAFPSSYWVMGHAQLTFVSIFTYLSSWLPPILKHLHEFAPKIVVVGVGGAGTNAVNNMVASGLAGVEFLALNTDAQHLSTSLSPTRLQIGTHLTSGLGELCLRDLLDYNAGLTCQSYANTAVQLNGKLLRLWSQP